ncbi:cupin domain-containing protein [Endozoicomonas arenosclerae]|uniref:cupin domain-containing protein n=1 Tax=Endozoicomonas arenosclerae TaxID=1633495 RepID=UPI000785E6DF|nr:cupin domain-containing protein [Endozoicomonas arenosclerae]
MKTKESWQDILIEKSNNLSKHCHIKNLLHNVEAVEDHITKIVTSFGENNQPHARAWTSGIQRHTIIHDLITATDQSNNLEKYLKNLLSSNKFCLSIDALSSYCDIFSESILESIISPLSKRLDINQGIDIYSFIGNYGLTPFGIHDDFDHTLLFHIGPGKKTAYIWERDRFKSLSGTLTSSTNYSDLLPYAEKYVLEPGDLIYIPIGDFHVFDTIEFSITLGITIYPENIAHHCVEGLKFLVSDESIFNDTFRKNLTADQLYNLRKLAIKSNGGFTYPPAYQEKEPNLDDLSSIFISSYTEFPLQTTAMLDREALIVRMRIMWSYETGVLPKLCSYINTSNRTPLTTLLENFKSIATQETVIALLRKIYIMKGVRIEYV